jgi:CRP/FNR family transcriptional regulator, anaerobic regulatory protein
MDQLIAFLNSIHELTPDTIEYLYKNLKRIEIPRKHFVLRQGHICKNIYFVEKGLLRCYYEKDGKEVSSWFMKEGDVIVSVISFFNQIESAENIQTLEDSILYYVDYVELQFLYNNFPEFNFVGRILTEKYYQLSEQRLYSMRMQRALDRYHLLIKEFPQFVLRVPSKYLASYLGITEETLSRIRAQK